MQKAKVKVLIALFAYSGNGGIASTIPEIAVWMAHAMKDIIRDDRIENVFIQTFCDTPITMTRNQAINAAKVAGCDMVLMLDSDNEPDAYLGADSSAKPFWTEAFNFAYDRLMQGVPTVIAAPYCGTPIHPIHLSEGEVPYLFEWLNDETNDTPAIPNFRIHRLNRNEAAKLHGIVPMAALPTGVCLFTLNAFDGLTVPYFAYEMNEDCSQKDSTEDVYATRNISLFWHAKIGKEVVFAACSSWAFHHKVKKVGKPTLFNASQVHDSLRKAIKENSFDDGEEVQDIDFTTKPAKPTPKPSQEEVPIEEDYPEPETHLVATHARRINGRKILGFHHETPMNELEYLLKVTAALGKNKADPITIVEIGSWVGESAIAMLEGLKSVKAKGRIYCVDTWEGTADDWTSDIVREHGSVESLFIKNVDQDLNDSIRAIRGCSVDVAESLAAENIDLLFIDGEHTYDACKDDIDAWLPSMAPDGIVMGHDYGTVFDGVRLAVDEVCDRAGLTPGVYSTIWYFSVEAYRRGLKATQERAHG